MCGVINSYPKISKPEVSFQQFPHALKELIVLFLSSSKHYKPKVKTQVMTFNLFSSKKEIDCTGQTEEKFELVSCPLNGKFCTHTRSQMNEKYAESVEFRKGKDFDKSIDVLKNAYSKTMDLPESPCGACAAFYRSTVVESIENIHKELNGMSKGIFSTNRYQSSCKKAEDVLKELKENKTKLKNAV
jgi:hypothetical protein